MVVPAGTLAPGHAAFVAVVSCSFHPSLSHSDSEAESLSLNSTATLLAKIDATSFNAFTRSTSFCSIFSTFRNFIPINEKENNIGHSQIIIKVKLTHKLLQKSKN